MMDRPNFTSLCQSRGLNATADILILCRSEDGLPPPPPVPRGYKLFMAVNDFIKLAVPIIFSVGFTLNCVAFYVFSRTKLKETSSSRYIAAIAVVDNVVLLTHFLTHLSNYFEVPVFEIYGLCQINNFFNCTCIFLSIWYVTSLVIDKFIGLYWPVKRSEYCTEFRAKCVAVSFAIFSIVFYHYLVWTIGPTERDGGSVLCLPMEGLAETYTKLNNLDYVVVAILPYFTIVILLCLMTYKVCTFKSFVRQVNGSIRGRTPSVSREQELKTMPLVMAVAVTTVSLGLLHNICRIFRVIHPVASTGGVFLSQVSYACKMLLYLITSERCRDQLLDFGRQLVRHVTTLFSCRRHSDTEPTRFISVNQQTDRSPEFHRIIEGAV